MKWVDGALAEGSPGESTESLFTKELRRRGYQKNDGTNQKSAGNALLVTLTICIWSSAAHASPADLVPARIPITIAKAEVGVGALHSNSQPSAGPLGQCDPRPGLLAVLMQHLDTDSL